MAKGVNLTLLIKIKKKRIQNNAKINALMKPAIKNGRTSGVKLSQYFTIFKRLAPAMIGTAMMNVKSEAAR